MEKRRIAVVGATGMVGRMFLKVLEEHGIEADYELFASARSAGSCLPFFGTQQEVLMEEAIVRDGITYQVGHTKEYVKIALESEEDLSNQMIFVELKNRSQIIH